MNRLCARALTTTALAALAGVVFPACSHDDASLFIRFVIAPTTNCTYTQDATQAFLPIGRADAALLGAYSPAVLVGNQLTARASADDVRAETSRVNIQGAVVKVVDPTDGSVQMDATVLSSGTIDPGTGAAPSYAPIQVTMLNAAALAHFDPKNTAAGSKLAVAYVKVFGQTLGGQSLESNEFQFPIQVCHGCLVKLTSTCSIPPAAGSSASLPVCVQGQDQTVDCSACYPNPACSP